MLAGQRLEAAAFLEPPHQSAFLVDEHHRAGRQRGNLMAQAPDLFGRFDVVVVLPGLAGIIEQDNAAEAESQTLWLFMSDGEIE